MEKKPRKQDKSVTNKRTIEDVRAELKKLRKKTEKFRVKLESEINVGLPELNDLLKENPNDYDTLHKRARFKADRDDLYGAIEDFMRIVEVYPCDYIAFSNIGIFRMELKEYEEGLAYSSFGVKI